MNGVCSYRDPIFHLRAVFGIFNTYSFRSVPRLFNTSKRPDSGHHYPSRAIQAYSAGRFVCSTENSQLHEVFHGFQFPCCSICPVQCPRMESNRAHFHLTHVEVGQSVQSNHSSDASNFGNTTINTFICPIALCRVPGLIKMQSPD